MRGRGRRPAGSGTREAIEQAARRQFAELGYQGTTMRGVAAEAGVDPRLVSHFFGSKERLFVTVVQLPIDPAETVARAAASGPEHVGRVLAEAVLDVLDDPRTRDVLTGLVRAAASEEQAATLVRALVTERLMGPLAQQAGGADPDLRAGLLGSQVVGLVLARHVVGVEALAHADRDRLVAALAPVFSHYLTGTMA